MTPPWGRAPSTRRRRAPGATRSGACTAARLRPLPRPTARSTRSRSLQPARALALLFVSRNLALAVALTVLAARRNDRALAWLLIADVALQVFDAAIAHDTSSIMPVLIGVLEALAVRQLVKAK